MKDRLNQLLKHEGSTALKFAELLEVQPSSISHLLSGRNKPSFDFLEKILLRFPNINPDWLILGNGNMFRDRNDLKTMTEYQQNLFTDVSQPEQPFDYSSVKNEAVNYSQKTNDEIFTKRNIQDKGIASKRNDIQIPVNDHQAVDIQNTHPKQELTKKVERIVFFYTDNSFTEYKPSK